MITPEQADEQRKRLPSLGLILNFYEFSNGGKIEIEDKKKKVYKFSDYEKLKAFLDKYR